MFFFLAKNYVLFECSRDLRRNDRKAMVDSAFGMDLFQQVAFLLRRIRDACSMRCALLRTLQKVVGSAVRHAANSVGDGAGAQGDVLDRMEVSSARRVAALLQRSACYDL